VGKIVSGGALTDDTILFFLSEFGRKLKNSVLYPVIRSKKRYKLRFLGYQT